MKLKIGIVSLEICLLVIASFAFAYFISFDLVSAEKNPDVCCEKTEKGIYCQGVTKDECDGNFVPSKCSGTSFCRFGCCVDEAKGIYVDSSRVSCNGKFVDESCLNIPAAKKGCCIIDDRTYWVTQQKCSGVWDSGKSEIECSLFKNENMGACVLGEDCKFITGKKCGDLRGSFRQGFLCTAPELNTSCERTDKTKCFDGSDEVYFVDSCGNQANIYDASKINDNAYWNKVVSKKESCGLDVKNINSQKNCGNCNRFESSVCGSALQDGFNVAEGDYYCKNNGCMYNRERYENGESWCIYEGKIGDGDDVPGSRHWKYVCSQGEILVEPCVDARKEICANADMIDETGNVVWSNAHCRVNNYRNCLSYNTLEQNEKLEKCEENVDCDVRHFRLSKDTSIDFCSPSYPRGWDLTNEEKKQDAIDTCGIASQSCTMIYVKQAISGKYECKANCDCDKEGFTQNMNEWCRSLGDCGMSANYVGDLSDEGYDSGGKAPAIKSQNYINQLMAKANDVPGQKAESGIDLETLAEFAGINLQEISDISVERGSALETFITVIFTVAVIVVLAIFVSVWTLFSISIAYYVAEFFNNIWLKWFGWGKIKRKYATFTCKPWMPEVGGDCGKCNKDSLKPCTAYRCQSLGQACEIVNKGTNQEMCVSKKNDGKPPMISPLYGFISKNEKYVEKTNGFEIKPLQGECVNAYSNLMFGVKTDKISQCRYSEEMNEWENMSDFGSNLALYEHKFNFIAPDPGHLNSLGLDYKEDFNLYLKCRDVHGNEYPTFYNIEMCVKDAPDEKEPEIMAVIPETDSLVGYGVDSVFATFYTNEPAECKWDNQDTLYEFMSKTMDCFDYTEIEEIDEIAPTTNGYECFANFTLTGDENKFYIRCKDQPWLDNVNRSDERKEMMTSYNYVLNRVVSALAIDWIEPNKDFEVKTSPASIVLKVKTSGGGEKHICRQKVDGFSWDNMFAEGNIHEYQLNYMLAGTHKILIECDDETGGKINGSVEFEIIHDEGAPEIARIYQQGGSLIIITDEDAECRYSTESDDFIFEKGGSMGKGLKHSISASKGKTYYVKCADEFGNVYGRGIAVRLLR